MRKRRRNMARKGVKEREERCKGGRKEGKSKGEVWRRKGKRV